MKPNRRFMQYLSEDRSLLVREIKERGLADEVALREFEYAYARWLTCATFLHRHKKLIAGKLSGGYERYKVQCKAEGVIPLPPWLYDYEHCVFIIDVNVIHKDMYTIERAEPVEPVPDGSTAVSALEDSGE